MWQQEIQFAISNRRHIRIVENVGYELPLAAIADAALSYWGNAGQGVWDRPMLPFDTAVYRMLGHRLT